MGTTIVYIIVVMRIVHIQYLNEKINFEVEASMSMEK